MTTYQPAIFIGGPLDGKEDYVLPPGLTHEVHVPWQTFYPGHPQHEAGISVYRFDGLAWRYVGEERSR